MVFAPLAPLFSRNFIGPIASKLTPKKMGDEGSNKLRNLGAPRGGSNRSMHLEVLVHLTQFLIKGTIIFLTWATIVPKWPCLILARVADLLRCRAKGPAGTVWA